MLKRSDIGAVFDNSEKDTPFRMIFMMDNRAVRVFYKYPQWLDDSIKERKTRKEVIFMHDKNKIDLLGREEILTIMQEQVKQSLELNKIKEVIKKISPDKER